MNCNTKRCKSAKTAMVVSKNNRAKEGVRFRNNNEGEIADRGYST